MPRRFAEEDEPDDAEDFDAEYDEWDEGDSTDDDDEPTIPCPYCRRPIHEDSERCPHCERFISREDAPSSAKPWWLVAGVAICLYIIYRWIRG